MMPGPARARDGVAARLAEVLGPNGWLTGDATAPYRRDWLDRYGVTPMGVARPADTRQVAEIVRLCRQTGTPIIPQGGNTGLCGGAITLDPGAIILSLARMNRIGQPDSGSGSVMVEAGVVLAALHAALDPAGLMFPLHLGAEGSAQIGGLIGTNAGGTHAFRFGTMQNLVLGLEVVTPDGEIWDGLRRVMKDNCGYQLRKLYCGAEGTLGVVTRAVLKVYDKPKRIETGLLVVPSMDAALDFAALLRAEASEFLHAMEFFSELGLSLALKHVRSIAFPLQTRGPAYVLVELAASTERVPLAEIMADILEKAMERGMVLDGAIATSGAQRAMFWRIRENMPEGQRQEGLQLKLDICVPTGEIARYIQQAHALCQEILPGARVNPFGHLGDGNIHYNLTPPEGQPDFGGREETIADALAGLAGDMGGTFAAEHGLGRAKVRLADRQRSRIERHLMRRLKQALDSGGLMNPGVLV